ncbi:hypothetical protein QR680_003650 [Steinernema hermaphroditum]|uniref:Uncharacterized protein n=1 Tax=Steinernema hermaphroditum TaxID=289476 RepID=A0AA39HM37_9BILA|nr:hypothetical protein QR680_003650 [Steinernema hermaphroditum]
MDGVPETFVREVCHLLTDANQKALRRVPTWGRIAQKVWPRADFFSLVVKIYLDSDDVHYWLFPNQSHTPVFQFKSLLQMITEFQTWRINKVFVSCEEVDIGNTASYQNALTDDIVQGLGTALKKQSIPISLLVDHYPMDRYPLIDKLLGVLPRVTTVEYRNQWVQSEVLSSCIQRGVLQRFSCTFSREILNVLPDMLKLKCFRRLAVRKNPEQEEDWTTFEEILQISDMDVTLGDEIVASRR